MRPLKCSSGLIKVIGQIIDTVGPALVKILDFIGEHLDVIGPIAVGVVAALLTFKKVTAAVIETVKAAMDSLNKVMAANPYALLIAGFAGLVTWSAALGNSYDNAREKAAELSSEEEQELVNKISETNQAYEGRKQAISDAYADIDYEYSAAQSLADELQTIVDAKRSDQRWISGTGTGDCG